MLRSAATCGPSVDLDEPATDLLNTLVVWVSAASLEAWTCDSSPRVHHQLQAPFFPKGPTLSCEVDLRELTSKRLYGVLDEFETELARYSALCHVGRHLVDQPDEAAQQLGCIWLTHFPDAESIERVARSPTAWT